MTATDTRQFMALMTIAQHHGRPGTPTDQAHIESFFSHLKGDWPHLTGVTDPAALDPSSPGSAPSTTRPGCTPRSGTSPPTTSITAADRGAVAPAPPACDVPGRSGSSRIEPTSHDHPHRHQQRPGPPGEEGRFSGCPPPARAPA